MQANDRKPVNRWGILLVLLVWCLVAWWFLSWWTSPNA